MTLATYKILENQDSRIKLSGINSYTKIKQSFGIFPNLQTIL